MSRTDSAADAVGLSWKAALVEEASRSFRSGRFPEALIAVGWVHLALFLVCQAIWDPAVESDKRHLALWIVEFLAVLATLQLVAGPRWYARTPAVGLVVRLWGTFLILSFNLATMNELSGWSLDWFKPVWGTLGTFLFATLAWLFDLRFLAFAVQMYFTGLLMVKFPTWNYAIYGVSWWIALQVLGGWLRATRRAAA